MRKLMQFGMKSDFVTLYIDSAADIHPDHVDRDSDPAFTPGQHNSISTLCKLPMKWLKLVFNSQVLKPYPYVE